jgi:hypothetical protein
VADLSEHAGSAEAVFRRQVDAFNARDLERYLATFAPDAVVHGLSDGPPLRGAGELRSHYAVRLADPLLHCEVVELIAWQDGWLLARERITSSAGMRDVTALFCVRGGAISRALIGL